MIIIRNCGHNVMKVLVESSSNILIFNDENVWRILNNGEPPIYKEDRNLFVKETRVKKSVED